MTGLSTAGWVFTVLIALQVGFVIGYGLARGLENRRIKRSRWED